MDVLYLLPHPGNPPAIRAMSLARNQKHVRDRQLRQTPLFKPTETSYRCLCISVPPSAIENPTVWTFSISNIEGPGIYLPFNNLRGRIDLLFGYGHDTEDTDDEPALFLRDMGDLNPRHQTRILDPMSEKESKEAKVDFLGDRARFLQDPHELFVGHYRFLVFRNLSNSHIPWLSGISFPLELSKPETEWRKVGPKMGKGAFGKVRLMRGMEKGRLRACKTMVIKESLVMAVAAARNELAIMKQLRHHDNVLKCFEDNEETREMDGTICHIFRFYLQPCHGDLQKLIWTMLRDDLGNHDKESGETNLALAYLPDIAKQMVAAVAYIHSKGFLHRDIKPGNILFRIAGFGETGFQNTYNILLNTTGLTVVFLLGDFGLSKASAEVCRSFAGTEMYIAPEIEDDSLSYDGAVDIMSLGITFLEVLFPKTVLHLYRHRKIAEKTTHERNCPGRRWYRDQLYSLASQHKYIHPLVGCLVDMMHPMAHTRPTAGALVSIVNGLPWNTFTGLSDLLANGCAPTVSSGPVRVCSSIQDVTMMDAPIHLSNGNNRHSIVKVANLVHRGFCASTISTVQTSISKQPGISVRPTSSAPPVDQSLNPTTAIHKNGSKDADPLVKPLPVTSSGKIPASNSSDLTPQVPGAFTTGTVSKEGHDERHSHDTVEDSELVHVIPGAYVSGHFNTETTDASSTTRKIYEAPGNPTEKRISETKALFKLRLPPRNHNAELIQQLCVNHVNSHGSSVRVSCSTLLPSGQRNKELKEAGYLESSPYQEGMTMKDRLYGKYRQFQEGPAEHELARYPSLEGPPTESSACKQAVGQRTELFSNRRLSFVGGLDDVWCEGTSLKAADKQAAKPRGILKPKPSDNSCCSGSDPSSHPGKHVGFGSPINSAKHSKVILPIRSINSSNGGSIYYPAVETLSTGRIVHEHNDDTTTIKPHLSGHGSKRSLTSGTDQGDITPVGEIDTLAAETAELDSRACHATSHNCVQLAYITTGGECQVVTDKAGNTDLQSANRTSPAYMHDSASSPPSDYIAGSPSQAVLGLGMRSRPGMSPIRTLKRKREGSIDDYTVFTSPHERKGRKVTWAEFFQIMLGREVEISDSRNAQCGEQG